MPLVLILSVNFFVFILCLMGAQACYFQRRWKWFWAAVVFVVVSAVCILDEANQWLTPPENDPRSIVVRSPTTPL